MAAFLQTTWSELSSLDRDSRNLTEAVTPEYDVSWSTCTCRNCRRFLCNRERGEDDNDGTDLQNGNHPDSRVSSFRGRIERK